MYDLIIQNISRHIQIEEKEISELISRLSLRKIKKHQFLLQRGSVATYDSFVIKGCLKASFTDQNGDEHITQFAVEDWWITDFDSFINGTPSQLEILALEDSEVLQIDYHSLEELFDLYPKFERFYRLINQRHFIGLYRCLLSFLSENAEQRYLDFSRQYPEFMNRIPQYQIASYLGITPEYLSKIRRKMARQEV